MTAATLRDVLTLHYVTAIDCDHEAKTDTVRCNCSIWTGTPQPSVGLAVREWADHVLDVQPARPLDVDLLADALIVVTRDVSPDAIELGTRDRPGASEGRAASPSSMAHDEHRGSAGPRADRTPLIPPMRDEGGGNQSEAEPPADGETSGTYRAVAAAAQALQDARHGNIVRVAADDHGPDTLEPCHCDLHEDLRRALTAVSERPA